MLVGWLQQGGGDMMEELFWLSAVHLGARRRWVGALVCWLSAGEDHFVCPGNWHRLSAE